MAIEKERIIQKELTRQQQYFVDKALEKGADHAVIFDIEDIVFDPRTFLKCRWGCAKWGKGHLCPSSVQFPKPGEFKEILEHYRWGLIIHSTDANLAQDISYDLELDAFWQGYHFAFSMSNCATCKECLGLHGKPCAKPEKTRPEFHSVGIDLFTTVHKFGLPLKTLRSLDETPNWYSAVFVE